MAFIGLQWPKRSNLIPDLEVSGQNTPSGSIFMSLQCSIKKWPLLAFSGLGRSNLIPDLEFSGQIIPSGSIVMSLQCSVKKWPLLAFSGLEGQICFQIWKFRVKLPLVGLFLCLYNDPLKVAFSGLCWP